MLLQYKISMTCVLFHDSSNQTFVPFVVSSISKQPAQTIVARTSTKHCFSKSVIEIAKASQVSPAPLEAPQHNRLLRLSR